VLDETRAASEMSVTFDAAIANKRKRARVASHAVATSLIAVVRDVTCTRIIARFKNVPSSRGSSKVRDHMIVSFDIIVQKINMFNLRKLYLHSSDCDGLLSCIPECILEI